MQYWSATLVTGVFLFACPVWYICVLSAGSQHLDVGQKQVLFKLPEPTCNSLVLGKIGDYFDEELQVRQTGQVWYHRLW